MFKRFVGLSLALSKSRSVLCPVYEMNWQRGSFARCHVASPAVFV